MKEFKGLKHGDEMTVEELSYKMKEHGFSLNACGINENDLKNGEITYYNETNCFAVLLNSVIINKRCLEYSLIVIDEVIMLW